MRPTPQELRDAEMICGLKEPTQYHKRELIRLRLKCDGHAARVINSNQSLLDKAFESARMYFKKKKELE